MEVAEKTRDQLLSAIRKAIYPERPEREFFHDQKALLQAITWPATWLTSRGLVMAPARYREFILARLAEVIQHGDPAALARTWFPRYFLKCIRQWFYHRGEDLYDELKHARNAIDQVLDQAARTRRQEHQSFIDILAEAHKLARPARRKRQAPDRQLDLF